MPRKGNRLKRLCKCGCGQQVAEYWFDGRFKGYYRYANGHFTHQWTTESKNKLSKTVSGLNHPRSVPLYTRRKIFKGHTRLIGGKRIEYWEIKTVVGRRWQLEHRYIMEQQLGRKLLTAEHVHHKNGDGLDNRQENLELLSAGEHTKRTMEIHGNPIIKMRTHPHKCPVCGFYHSSP